MPITTFRLICSGNSLDVDLSAFQLMLPSSMRVVSRDGAYYIEIRTSIEEDAGAQLHVDRELDRLYFLTCIRVNAEMCKRIVSATVSFAWSVHGSIPAGTKPQDWNYSLGLQLRLWSLACQASDPLVKIILLYQIVELSRPAFPSYSDSTKPPHPLTECKLLRHLVAHAGDVTRDELKAYCAYLGLPPVMLDRTDSGHVELLASKCKLVEEQAKQILHLAL